MSDYDSDYDSGYPTRPTVVVVGEKPSVARSFSKAMCNRRFLDWDVKWEFTSTRGHVIDLEFDGRLPTQRRGLYLVNEQTELFDMPVTEYLIDTRRHQAAWQWTVKATLEEKCTGADFVVMCLDNDLEGEKIAEEVEGIVKPILCQPRFGFDVQIWRCRFSSLDTSSLQNAMALPPYGTLQAINRDLVHAVDVRRELDLRSGFAFSRAVKHLMWNYLTERSQAGDHDSVREILCLCQGFRDIGSVNADGDDDDDNDGDGESYDPSVWPVPSYGPCQLPTLGFVVKNDLEVGDFQCKQFWKVKVRCVFADEVVVAWSDVFPEEREAVSEATRLRDAAAQYSAAKSSAGSAGRTMLATLLVPQMHGLASLASSGGRNKIRWEGGGNKKGRGNKIPSSYKVSQQVLKLCLPGEVVPAESAVETPPNLPLLEASAPDKPASTVVAKEKAAEVPVVTLSKEIQAGCKRPLALNTPRMLQLASDCLGIQPSDALNIAEDLYLAGLITYPRSETDAYNLETDLEQAVRGLASPDNANVREGPRNYAAELLVAGLEPARQDGRLLGDHDPVMPVGDDRSRQVHDQASDLYDLICRVFLASLSPDAVIEETSILFEMPFSGCTFRATGRRVRSLGWIEVLPIIDVEDSPLREEAVRAAAAASPLRMHEVSVEVFGTQPPPRLRESALLKCMERHGIGTDASMPGHIQKIMMRNYVRVQESVNPTPPHGAAARHVPANWFLMVREMYQMKLGSVLFRWFMVVAPELALPTVRADVEAACLAISRGELVSGGVLDQFRQSFRDSFWKVFVSPQARVHKNLLLGFLGKTDEERRNDSDWRRAESAIRNAAFKEMAQRRTRAIQEFEVASAPAEASLKQCLMIDAECLGKSGDKALVRNLAPGDTLPAVVDQRGRLVQGECSVSTVRCLTLRERDVATVRLQNQQHPDHNSSFRVTSNHSLMARQPQDLSWGPVVARDLVSRHQVAVVVGPLPCDLAARHQVAAVVQSHVQREGVRVVELAFDNGQAAIWLRTADSELASFVASYGESPCTLNSQQQVVAIWGFSRAPLDFRKTLNESAELQVCRKDLEHAGFSFKLPRGGYMFVRPEQAEPVLAALRRKSIDPRPNEIVVMPEFETRLEEALGLVPARLNVHRRSLNHLRLDAAMGDIAYFRNGSPFRCMVNGMLVQGRRTFIEIGEVDDGQRTAHTW